MSKSTISRSVEATVIDRPTDQAAEIRDRLMSQRGPCPQCVFYRNLPGVYCLRYGECFPETQVSWRERVKDTHYGPGETRHTLHRV